ncbi:MAG: hypothetical protein KDC57_10305 [Saprospiraceae bacterium]|nr:hypothetical protein [Saprospiraceae bacterium]
MKTNIDTLLEGQKKAFDLWTETTRKMADAFAGGLPKEEPTGVLDEWLDNQKKYWDAILNTGNLKNAFERAPEDMKKWAEAQTEFATKWLEFYQEFAGHYGMKNEDLKRFFKAENLTVKSWQEWMDKNNEWVQKNILDNMPFSQQFHLRNFKDLYESMGRYWDYFNKMIEYGITEWNSVGRIITPDAYRDIIGKFIGFKPVKDVEDWIRQTNELFEKYIEFYKETGITQDWTDLWTKMSSAYRDGKSVEGYQGLLDLNQHMKEGLDRFYHLAGKGKEVEMGRELKEIQFTYLAFIIRSMEIQTRVFEVSQPALTQTLDTLYHAYQQDKKMPDYHTFFQEYVNQLEKSLIQLMEGVDYATMQGELSKLAAVLKGKMDHLYELAFDGTPFLMKSFSDEVAKEMAALRKRIRDLEMRLAKVDHPVNEKKKDDLKASLLQATGIETNGTKDDLKKISGIGPKLEETLNAIGIQSFRQLARLTEKHYAMLDELMESFQGRAKRDQWAEQAKKFIQ